MDIFPSLTFFNLNGNFWPFGRTSLFQTLTNSDSTQQDLIILNKNNKVLGTFLNNKNEEQFYLNNC